MFIISGNVMPKFTQSSRRIKVGLMTVTTATTMTTITTTTTMTLMAATKATTATSTSSCAILGNFKKCNSQLLYVKNMC